MSILILIAFVIMILSYQILQQFHKEVKQAGKQFSEIFSLNFNQSKGNKLYNSYKNGIRKVLISVRIHQRPSNYICLKESELTTTEIGKYLKISGQGVSKAKERGENLMEKYGIKIES